MGRADLDHVPPPDHPSALPPLRALVAFEATVRLGSMVLAARELGLTPSAVSHRIAALEGHFGHALFRRAAGRAEPTREARRLARSATEALRQIALACGDLDRGRAPQHVTLHAAPSFAAKWLRPRLQEFVDGNRGVGLRVLEAVGPVPQVGPGELAIVYGEHARPGAVRFLGEVVTPLCAPGLLRGPRGRHRRRRPEDVLALPLLHSRNAVGWREWCEAQGIRDRPLEGVLFDRSHLAIDAACDGRGVVLESNLLTEAERRAGRLVPALPEGCFSLPSVGYAIASHPAPRPATARLLLWLLGVAGTPAAGPSVASAGPPGRPPSRAAGRTAR